MAISWGFTVASLNHKTQGFAGIGFIYKIALVVLPAALCQGLFYQL